MLAWPSTCCSAASEPPRSSHWHAHVCRIRFTWKSSIPVNRRTRIANDPGEPAANGQGRTSAAPRGLELVPSIPGNVSGLFLRTSADFAPAGWAESTAESVFRESCLDREWFAHQREAKIVIEQWRWEYNHVRPHSSLGYRSPAQVGGKARAAMGVESRGAGRSSILGHLWKARSSKSSSKFTPSP